MSSFLSVFNLVMNAGKAAAGPKIASVLGPRGIQMPKFCDAFNKLTSSVDHKRYELGDPLTVKVFLNHDKTYEMLISKAPPVSYLVKKALSIDKGSTTPGRNSVAHITHDQVRAIALLKMSDMNTDNEEAAMRMVIGAARSMGVDVVEE